MLNQSYKLFLEDASRLPGFKPGTKEECRDIEQLSSAYVKYELKNDRDMMSSCISALMIRYWYMIPFLFDKCKSLKLEIDDVVTMLSNALLKALKLKSWLDSTKAISRDKHGAEKCINQCITSMWQGAFQESNYDCRKINYMTFSVEESVEIFGDSSECLYTEDVDEYAGVKDLVEQKLKSNKVLDALVIDMICFGNCFNKSGFNKSMIVSGLKNTKQDYVSLFKDRYQVDKKLCTKIDSIIKNKRKVLNVLVDNSLSDLTKDREIINNAFGCC